MTLAENARFAFTPDMTICRVLNGMWQVSGGHGRIDPSAAVAAIFAYHQAGFTTWDLADHYGPAEDLIGTFRRQFAARHGEAGLGDTQAFTKWVPHPGAMTRRIVEDAIDVSRRRMGVDRLDLLQFHWWDYADSRYLDALKHLADLRDQGKIRNVSNQVQYSLVDQRPAGQMAAFCAAQGISLLTYGTLLGGLLSEAWLGRTEPGRGSLSTVSHQK